MDDQLGFKIKRGDEKSFELFFRMNYIRLCTFANKFLNDHEKSKEIVQDAFAKIWERRAEINPGNSLKSYIFTITKNLCINLLQKEKIESRYADIYRYVYLNNMYSVQESLIAKELEDRIMISLGKIPVECRKVFELSRFEGLKYKEIATAFNISVKTVEAHMSKALRILRIELYEYLPGSSEQWG